MSRPRAAPAHAVAASAPGKLILAGEHAVVHGRPALIAALDLRLTARFTAGPGDGFGSGEVVDLTVPPLDLRTAVPWGDVVAYAAGARRRWSAYTQAPGAAAFAAVRGDDPAHLVKVALGEAAAHLGEDGGPPLAVNVEADLPVGAGFGSSAAAAVALVAGYLGQRGAFRPGDPADLATVERLAFEVERRQHGMPSGVDGATVLHGGILWAERDAAGRLATRPFGARKDLLAHLQVFHTGPPAEPTGTVVANVRERLAAERPRIERALDVIAEATGDLRDLLAAPETEPPALLAPVAACHRALVELGVVPPAVRELVARIEEEGGAAKISGAGSLAGPGAGSLLVVHPDPGRTAEWSFLAPFRRYPVALGAAGLRVDVSGEGGSR